MSDEEKKRTEQEEFDKLFDDLFKTNAVKDNEEKKEDSDNDEFMKSLFSHDEEKIVEKKEDDNFDDWLKELIDEIDKEEQEKKKQEVTTTPAKPLKPSFTSKLQDKPRAPKPPEHIQMWGSGKKNVKMPLREENVVLDNNKYGKITYSLIIMIVMIIGGIGGFFISNYSSHDIRSEVCKTAEVIMKDTYTGDKILIDTFSISESGKTIIDQGYIDAHISNLMYNLIKPGEKVIDIGAGFGYNTLYLARIVGNNGIVYAFEARKCIYELLEKSIIINKFENVQAFNYVMFSDNMRVFIDTDDYKRRSSFGVNNIVLEQDNVYSDTQGDIVNTRTLDSVLQNLSNVSMININAHGNELSIILGAKNLIANSPNLKIITTWSKYEMLKYVNVQNVVQQLLGNGFRFWIIKPSSGKLVELTKLEHIMQVERGRFLMAKSIN